MAIDRAADKPIAIDHQRLCHQPHYNQPRHRQPCRIYTSGYMEFIAYCAIQYIHNNPAFSYTQT